VSEGRGLGEERLRGWLTKEREESSGTGQIPMDDGGPVLERATGNVGSGRWRSAPMARAWTRGERGETGTGWWPALMKSGLVVLLKSGPGWHSAGRRSSNWNGTDPNSNGSNFISNSFKLSSIRTGPSHAPKI
jgi:hypothetical protein